MRGALHVVVTACAALLIVLAFPWLVPLLAPSLTQLGGEIVGATIFVLVAAVESRAPDSDLVSSTSPVAKLAHRIALSLRIVRRGHRREFHGPRGLGVYAALWIAISLAPLALGLWWLHELLRLAAVAACIAFAEHVLQDTVTPRGVGGYRGFAIEGHSDDEIAAGMILAALGTYLAARDLLPLHLLGSVDPAALLGLAAMHAVVPWCWAAAKHGRRPNKGRRRRATA